MTSAQPEIGALCPMPVVHPTVRQFDARTLELFARITRLATCALSVPISAILVRDGADFRVVAHIGLAPVGKKASTWSRVVDANATHALVIEDEADPRLASLADGTSAEHIGAYAQYPLMLGDAPVGFLVAMDERPRQFTDDEAATLIDLAHWAAAVVQADGERKLVAQLDTMHLRTEAILASAAEGIAGLDNEGRVQFINPAGWAILGWSREELMGTVFHDLAHFQRPDGTAYPAESCPVHEVRTSGVGQSHLADHFTHKDGRLIPVNLSVGPILEGGEVTGVVMVFVDSSARVEMEQMRDQFMSIVSHEMRTPLTSLLGALRLIHAGAAGKVDGDMVNLLAIAMRNGNRLARLVNDVLDTQRASTGTLQLNRKSIELDSLLRAAVESVEGLALEANVAITWESSEISVWGDSHRLQQILTNLLGNAIRFSSPGSEVRLTASDKIDRVEIAVADQGKGIPHYALDRIFEAFWQVDSQDQRIRSGSGLGLAISKGLAEQHGGTIAVQSELGVGTTFTLSLPLRARDIRVTLDKRVTRKGR